MSNRHIFIHAVLRYKSLLCIQFTWWILITIHTLSVIIKKTYNRHIFTRNYRGLLKFSCIFKSINFFSKIEAKYLYQNDEVKLSGHFYNNKITAIKKKLC